MQLHYSGVCSDVILLYVTLSLVMRPFYLSALIFGQFVYTHISNAAFLFVYIHICIIICQISNHYKTNLNTRVVSSTGWSTKRIKH